MSYADLHQALYTPILDANITVTDLSGNVVTVEVKTDNVSDNKPLYSVACSLEFDAPEKESKEGTQSYNGAIVCDISIPVKSASSKLYEIADQIRQVYPMDQFLTYGSQRVEIVSVGLGDSETSEQHFTRPLEIEFFVVETLN